MHIMSNSVAQGIRLMLDDETHCMSNEQKKSAEDTAWFLETMNKWFDYMSSRHPVMALSRANSENYEKATKFLKHVISIMREMEIGNGHWKPVQKGIILSTTSVLALSDRLLKPGGMSFLLTARLTQDCLENIFSTVRQGNPVPTPIEFRNSLKMITVAQYLKTPKTSSYSLDDSTYLASYLEKLDSRAGENSQPTLPQEVIVITEKDEKTLCTAEQNSLYYLTGESHFIPQQSEQANSDLKVCLN